MEQAQPGQVSGQLESLIQQAIQAGIPPQQILPLLSQLQNPSGGGIGGLSTQCLQAGVGSAASQAVTNPSLHSSAHQTGLGGIHGLQALSQQPTSMAAAVAQMSAGQGTPAVHQATAQSQAQLPPGAVASSLPWPIFQPIVSVPHFDMATYEKVNLDVQPSALPNGQDLPLNDVNTLRFFFNFGVQHARAILLRQHLQSQQANVAQNPHLLSFLQNPDTALALQQQLLRAQQQAALLTGQRPGERPNLSQTTTQVPQQIPGLPGNLSMNSLQNTLAQHLARNFAPAQSSFKPVNASSNDPLETLLQSALLGANPAAAAQIKAAMASQGQGSFAVPSQPLGHHLTAQQHLASQAQHLEQLQHDLMRPHAINPALIGSHAANSTTNSIAGQTMMSTLASATSGTQTSHSNGGGGQVAVSPKNLPIPADPVPRKSSSVHGIQDQNYEQLQNLKLQGLMALRNPNPMNENLQKQIAAAASALTAGQPMAASAQNIITNSTAPGQGITTTATVPVSSMPSLAAQLSAAMVAGTVFMPTSAGSVAMTNVSGITSHAGLPTIASSNATRSLTYGSSGHQSAHGIPTSTPTSITGTTNSSGIGIASIPITVAATSIRPTASSPSVPLEVDGTPTILAASEMHYSETFKKTQGLPVHGTRQSASPMSGSGETRRKSGLYSIMNTESKEDIKKSSSEKPPVTSMINYVNSYMSQAKSQLQAQGVGLHMDPAGRPIDYSSRPIDPIFRKAREKLEDVRAYHDTETPSAVQTGGSTTTSGGSTSSPPEAEAANPQRSGCLIGISSKKSDPKQESSVSVKTETTTPKKEEPQEQEDIKKEESSASESQKRDVYSYDDGSPEEKRLRIASTDDEGES